VKRPSSRLQIFTFRLPNRWPDALQTSQTRTLALLMDGPDPTERADARALRGCDAGFPAAYETLASRARRANRPDGLRERRRTQRMISAHDSHLNLMTHQRPQGAHDQRDPQAEPEPEPVG
jgi:hypothetical protein